MGRHAVAGYEALVRTDEPTIPHPLDLFEAAERLGRLQDVARAIRSRAAADASALPEGVLLFVNVHPEDLQDGELSSASSPLSAIAGRVVLELTERASLDRVVGLQLRIDRLRQLGFRIALDDLGAGYAGLSSFTLLQPDFVKLDASLIRSIDTSPPKRSIVRAMLQLATGDLNLIVIAEGVEEHLQSLRPYIRTDWAPEFTLPGVSVCTTRAWVRRAHLDENAQPKCHSVAMWHAAPSRPEGPAKRGVRKPPTK